jgi:outer membrane protein assembly factor BamB
VTFIIGTGVIALAVNRLVPHVSRQHQIYAGGVIVISIVAAFLVWLLLFSRLRWRARALAFFSIVVLLAMVSALFRIRGVSGDLLPVIEWRWQKPQADSLADATASVGPPAIPAGAGEWPQFLGPRRNTQVDGPRLERDWKRRPPHVLWRRRIGTGWSGFAVSAGYAVTQEQRGEQELVVAYELATGRPLWSHSVAARYFTTLAGEGPRANPAIDGGQVFAQGATGVLSCLDLATGRMIWEHDIVAANHSHVPDWGFSSSPLVHADHVIVAAGGKNGRSLVAYRRGDGTVAWAGGDAGPTYSSPVFATFAGQPQFLVFGSRALAAHDATSGRVLWSFRWPGGHPHVAAPVPLDDTSVVLSSGYGTGAARIAITRTHDGWSAEEVWRTNKLRAKFTNFTAHHGHLYGLDDGTMVCLEATTGERRWKDGDYGHGQQILAGGLLLVMAENGEIVLIDPQPDALHELGRFRVFGDKTWNPPALAGAYLVGRNDKEACCLRLAIE